MSRKKRKPLAEATPPPPTRTPGAAAELVRRGLLSGLTALIVARPFVLGEDPGLLAPLSDSSNLVLTALWLLLAVGWASWNASALSSDWKFGWVEAGLLGTAVLAFASVIVAGYQHPAQLIGWEWLVLFLVLFLVRKLARTDEDRRGLLSAFLAVMVSIALYSLYQYTVELPGMREKLSSTAADPFRAPAAESVGLVAGSTGQLLAERAQAEREAEGVAAEEAIARRLEENNHAFGTYAHPNSYASVLVLFLPLAIGIAWTRWRTPFSLSLRVLTVLAALMLATGLWLTHSRGALLGLLLSTVVFGGWAARRWLLAHRTWALAGSVAAIALFVLVQQTGLLALALGKGAGTASNRLDYWSATWQMIVDHLWLGVGGGNFGRLYPQYMAATAHETITDPHNFVLEVWSSHGVFAVVVLLLALGVVFYRGLATRPESASATEGNSPHPVRGTRWEFYLGGMVGLLLGYFLREGFQSSDEVLLLGLPSSDEVLLRGVVAGVRSLFWFALFALFFEGPAWSHSLQRLALVLGVGAVLLNLSVSGGISFPSVAQPLWLAIGLLLATTLPIVATRSSSLPARMVPLPVLAGVALAYLTAVLFPVGRSASLAWNAFSAARFYREQAEMVRPRLGNPAQLLREKVVVPLREATREDPGNAHRSCQLANWLAELWKMPYLPTREREAYSFEAILAVNRAEQLDPNGREGYLTHYRLCRLFARSIQGSEPRRRQYALAAEAMQNLARIDPNNAQVHYQLAEMLYLSGQPKLGTEAGEKALRLHDLATHRERQLGPAQRAQLQVWKTTPPVEAKD